MVKGNFEFPGNMSALSRPIRRASQHLRRHRAEVGSEHFWRCPLPSDGKVLERLVTDIEKLLLGERYTVTPNDRVFDDEGNQIAEFDIKIEGKVGSTTFKWLIECRDRPSQGPAPNSWIQHLSGRKQLFDFDKVIAVSTTGFSPGAKEAAKKLNITLREVASVQEISSEFGTIKFKISKVNLSLRGEADFDFPMEMRKEVAEMAKEVNGLLKDPKIRFTGESGFLTLSQFIQRDLLHNKKVHTPEIDEIREVTFKQQAKMELLVGKRIFKIVGLIVPITLEYSFHPAKVLTVKSYGEEGAAIGEEVALSSEMPDVIVRNVVLITRKNGDVYVVQTASTKVIPK